jgi:mannitol/fructose-specific phosphotransferase system IIA component (Ntr-type)
MPTTGIQIKISEIIPKEKIIPDLKSRDKEGIINELIDLFHNDKNVYDIDALRGDIFKREKIMSTGIGNGFAIPHCTTDVVKDYIAAFGKSSNPIDFESIDGEPVFLFFLIAGNNLKQHMKLLGNIARFMNNEIKEKLLKANNSDEIYSIFNEFEIKYLRNIVH